MGIEPIIIAANLGVGCFLGFVIFYMYRIDKKGTEERLFKLLEEDLISRRKNTEVLTELVTIIKMLNRSR